MPTYEYECDNCSRKEELFYRNPTQAPMQYRCCKVIGSDPEDDLVYCPGYMQRQIGSGAGCIFRGPGFHCNDYPHPNKGEPHDPRADAPRA